MERTAEFCCLLNRILLVTFASLLCSHATMSLTIINLSWGRLGSAQKILGALGFTSHLERATHEMTQHANRYVRLAGKCRRMASRAAGVRVSDVRYAQFTYHDGQRWTIRTTWQVRRADQWEDIAEPFAGMSADISHIQNG